MEAVSENHVELKGKILPIGKQYKEDLLRIGE